MNPQHRRDSVCLGVSRIAAGDLAYHVCGCGTWLIVCPHCRRLLSDSPTCDRFNVRAGRRGEECAECGSQLNCWMECPGCGRPMAADPDTPRGGECVGCGSEQQLRAVADTQHLLPPGEGPTEVLL